MGRRLCKSGDEQDVHKARRIYVWTQRTGATARVKRRSRRRERRDGKRQAREDAT
jgi:hypothetical protein